ncbi:MAG: triose-phosphate isomerase [Nanoarchaeota archaeon]
MICIYAGADMKPIILLNFKTYEKGIGEKALELAKIVDRVANEEKASIVIVADALSVFRVSQSVKVPVFAQHVDPIGFGSNTGHVLAESVKASGAVGAVLNHAEKKMKMEDLKKAVERCKESGLKTAVCAKDMEEVYGILNSKPDYIAFEDPELIGSGIPISKAHPGKVRDFADFVNNNSDAVPLCGAGISTGDDVRAALELGTKGVILASAFVNADDPETVLRDLIKF